MKGRRGELITTSEMRATVETAVTAEQVLVDNLAQPQTGQAASKGSSNRTEHGTRAHSSWPSRRADMQANAGANQSASRTRRSRTANGTSNGTDSATDALAVIGIHHPPGSAAGTEFGHRRFLMRQAS